MLPAPMPCPDRVRGLLHVFCYRPIALWGKENRDLKSPGTVMLRGRGKEVCHVFRCKLLL
jgi:hypothetical protein